MLDEEQLPFFDTATDTVTDLVNIVMVTYCRMLRSVPRSCLVHTVNCFDSEGSSAV